MQNLGLDILATVRVILLTTDRENILAAVRGIILATVCV
jgi:hypothetical protein